MNENSITHAWHRHVKAVPGAPFIDIKSSYNRDILTAAGFTVWRL
jgi:hypothetical protein